MEYLLLGCALVMFASLSGKLVVWKSFGRFIERHLEYMVSFAAGVFLVFAWQLGAEVLEHMEFGLASAWIVGGAIGVTLACRFFPHGQRAHGPHDGHAHGLHGHLDAHRMLLSDSIHNVGDGIVLAASFAINVATGFAVVIGVFIHEVVQEVAEFFVLRDAGYSVRKALFYNFLTSSTVLVGAVGAWYLLDIFEALEGPLLGVAAGGIIAVVFGDLVPHSLQELGKPRRLVAHALLGVAGAALMLGISTLVPSLH